jgi:hypothetical protein
MHGALSTIGVFLLGGVGWLVTSFVGRPVRQFVDLRGEIIQRSVLYGNVGAVEHESVDGSVKQIERSAEEVERLHEAIGVFRDLAARMRAFALNERVAVWLVRWWYDPLEASEALLRVSNELHRSGGTRADAWDALERALGFRK